MNRLINPPGLAAPSAGAYSHVVEVPANARHAYLAGQVGLTPDGVLEDGIAAQAERTWSNIAIALAAVDMEPRDIVRITTFCVDARHLEVVTAARERVLGDHRPASSFIVAALAYPQVLLEIDVVAAKA